MSKDLLLDFFSLKFRVNCPCKYNFSDDGKKVTPRRDVPNYPKVCPLGLSLFIVLDKANFINLWWLYLSGMYSTRCLRRLLRHSRSQRSTSGTGNITRSVDVACPWLVHVPFHVMQVTDGWSCIMFCLPLWLQMLSCLEYMYHDLGLVKEFNMNPITLKRWLVRIHQ